MRGKLDSRYAIYVQESEKLSLLSGLQDSEDWLYTEEGEDATKSAYVQRLDGLKVMGDPIVLRWRESEERPKAAAALRESLNLYLSQAQSGDDKYSHIGEADLNKVVSYSPFAITSFADSCVGREVRDYPTMAGRFARPSSREAQERKPGDYLCRDAPSTRGCHLHLRGDHEPAQA